MDTQKHKPRIAVIGLKGLPAFGGAATVGENIILQLADTFDFTVYATSSHTAVKKTNAYTQIIFRKSRIAALNTFFYFLKSLFHALFKGKYDYIHLHHYSSGFITPFLRLKYKVLLTLHGVYHDNYSDVKFNFVTNFLLKFTQWLNVRFATVITSVSKSDAEFIQRKYGVSVIYIPNGINVTSQSLPARRKSGEPFVAFSAGRIYQIKGLHILLEAMHLNNDQGKLVVIGNLDHVPAYKKQVHQQAKGLNVDFLPLIKEKQVLFDRLSGAEFFIFPSTVEAMAMMLLEVATLGVPLIASDLTANTAVFSNEDVLFFEAGNPASLAEKIKYARAYPGEMELKAQKAFRKLCLEYNWATISDSYKKVLNHALSGK
jgi:glycosyltransferase involved in cell wall biosynthesis